jgi:hypothetical protein
MRRAGDLAGAGRISIFFSAILVLSDARVR